MQQERPDESASSTSGFLDAETLLGVRVVEADTPALTGRELASQMGAELVSDPESTAEALGRRVEAGLTPPLVLQPEELEDLREQAAAAQRILDRANVDAATRAELVSLGDELARADRIRLRTESALTESLSRRLSASTGLSVHPDSLRAAAAAVAEARARVTLSTRELDELGPPPDARSTLTATAVATPPPGYDPGGTTGGYEPVSGPVTNGGDDPWAGPEPDYQPMTLDHEAPDRKKPPLWVFVGTAALVPLGLLLALFGVLSGLLFVGLVVFVFVPTLVAWYHFYKLWAEEQAHEAAIAASNPPPSVSSFTPPASTTGSNATIGSFGDDESSPWHSPSPQPGLYDQPHGYDPAHGYDEPVTGDHPVTGEPAYDFGDEADYDPELSAWHDQLESLSVAVDHAEDILRGSLARWESLAGPGAHPDDVESVIQAKDPQFQFASLAAQESATMRTANAFHRKAMAKWRVAWAVLGYDEPPTPDQVHIELTPASPVELRDAQMILDRAEAATRWAAAGALIDQPLVVADLQGWFPTDEVSELVHSLPAGVHVVVVRPTTESSEA